MMKVTPSPTHPSQTLVTSRSWRYYQEWNDALFLHFEVPLEDLCPHVPKPLQADVYNGMAYISVVAFTMQRIRPRGLPAVRFVSDFHEINVRTYVTLDGFPGVYFLNIEAEKNLSTLIARALSGLPYEKAFIRRKTGRYTSVNAAKNFHLNAQFQTGVSISDKSDLDIWLTERYCLFLEENGNTYRFDIDHKPWELREVQADFIDLHYSFDDLELDASGISCMHYSPGVQVYANSRITLG